MHYVLEPEVSGELGKKTIINTDKWPPVVFHLHFIFKGWMGDDLIECFPVFMITEVLKMNLDKSNLSGFQIENCEVDISDEMKLLQPDITPPIIFWLKVSGEENKDDFFIDNKNKLCISEKAFTLLTNFHLNYCEISKQ